MFDSFKQIFDLVQVTELSWGWTALFFYAFIFLFFAGVSAFQMFFGAYSVLKGFRKLANEDVYRVLQSNSLPPITFIIPAYNESDCIVHTVKNLLTLSYRYKQIIIINDGSKDATFELLMANFSLRPVPPSFPGVLPTQRIRSYYVSNEYPELYVIDKDNGGKADALNAALNMCATDIFIAADADTLVDDEALNRLIYPFLMNPTTVVAHASIGLLNGCKIGRNRILKFIFPKKIITGLQAVDYMKSFLVERMGLSWTKGALVVPGNFGLFKKDVILQIGGYDTTSLVEDTEIITHMHQYLLYHKIDYEITYVPDIVAWTAGPETVEGLVKQRLRWYRGTTDNILRYWYMWFNPRYRSIGMFICPMTVFEKVAPLIEISGFVILFFALIYSSVDYSIIFILAVTSWLFLLLMIAFTMLVEMVSYQTYSSWADFFRILRAILCYIGYHYILLYCRVRGLYVPKRASVHWEPIRTDYDKVEKS